MATIINLNDYNQNRFNLKLSKNLAKLLLTVGIVTIVDTYVNGSSWYRIYSDGWCEQGGAVSTGTVAVGSGSTVTFLKAFTDTGYTITFLSGHSDTGTSNEIQIKYANSYYGTYQLASKKATSIKLCGKGTWHACGYIA